MRFLLKLLAAPVVLALTLFVWLCMGVLYLSSLVLGIISTIVGLLGLAVLLIALSGCAPSGEDVLSEQESQLSGSTISESETPSLTAEESALLSELASIYELKDGGKTLKEGEELDSPELLGFGVLRMYRLDEQFRADMDQAVSIERRLAAMKKVYDAGIRTVCFISPVFPGITDFEAIFERVRNQCDLVWLENLNLRGGFKKDIMDYIQEKYPEDLKSWTGNTDISLQAKILCKMPYFCKGNQHFCKTPKLRVRKICKEKKEMFRVR